MLNNSKQPIKDRVKQLENDRHEGIQRLTTAVKAMNEALTNGGKMSPRLRQLIDRCDTQLI